jgi:hypothetical protein
MASRWRLRNPENLNAGNREINPENPWNCMGCGKVERLNDGLEISKPKRALPPARRVSPRSRMFPIDRRLDPPRREGAAAFRQEVCKARARPVPGRVHWRAVWKAGA